MKAVPENAAGPFYVEDGCCLACGVTVDTAPEIFDWAPRQDHCYVRRQPEGEAEIYRTLQACMNSELSCIRYRGEDPSLLKRIADIGLPECCDAPAPPSAGMVRDRAVFRSPRAGETAVSLADRFRAYLRDAERDTPYRIRGKRLWAPARVIFCWMPAMIGTRFHTIIFSDASGPAGAFEASLSGWEAGGYGRGFLLHEWLTHIGATEIGWTSPAERDAGGPGLPTPI